MQWKNADLELALQRYREAAETTRRVRRGTGLKDWALYTAAAGSAVAAGQSAEAAVIYSGVQNIMVTRTAGSNVLVQSVDLNGDSVDDVAITLVFNTFTAGAYLVGGYMLTGGNQGALRLSASSTVSLNAGSFGNLGLLRIANEGGASAGYWPGGNPTATSGFAGVAFYDTGINLHFGWLRLALLNNANGVPDKLTLVDWAYESVAGDPIHMGDVPEPSGLALLAAGAAGVAAFRRRRKGQEEA